MKKYYIIVLAIALSSCMTTTNSGVERFSKDDIASLQMETTKRIEIVKSTAPQINVEAMIGKEAIEMFQNVDSASLVNIETTNECLISEIKSILVSKENIYIVDAFQGGSIVILDRKGKFIKRINVGPGPEEISQLVKMAFNKKTNELIVYHGYYFSYYTSNGTFLKSEKLPIAAHSFEKINEGYLFKSAKGVVNKHLNEYSNCRLFVLDEKFKLLSAGKQNDPYNESYMSAETKNTTTFNDKISITFPFNDTIFEFANNKLIPKLILNFGTKKIPNNLFKNDNFRERLKKNDYHFYIGDYHENSTHEFLMTNNFYSGNIISIFRDKTSGNCIFGASYNYPKDYFPCTMPITSTDDRFVSIIHVNSKFVNSKFGKEYCVNNNIKEFDNPILVFYKLKHF